MQIALADNHWHANTRFNGPLVIASFVGHAALLQGQFTVGHRGQPVSANFEEKQENLKRMSRLLKVRWTINKQPPSLFIY